LRTGPRCQENSRDRSKAKARPEKSEPRNLLIHHVIHVTSPPSAELLSLRTSRALSVRCATARGIIALQYVRPAILRRLIGLPLGGGRLFRSEFHMNHRARVKQQIRLCHKPEHSLVHKLPRGRHCPGSTKCSK